MQQTLKINRDKTEQTNLGLIVVLFLGICLNCFITFVAFTIFVMLGRPDRKMIKLWGWTGIVFVSLLSMTKVPITDLEWILDHFHLAGQMDYFSHLALLGKEPAYQTFSYVMHYVLSDNEKLFVVVLSTISLSFLYISLYTLSEKIKLGRSSFVFCVFLMLFFPFFFGIPVHIVRQTMAMSIFIFVLVKKICYEKIYWPLVMVVPLIHSTTILFLPFLFLNILKSPFNMKMLIYYICIGLFFFFIQEIAVFLLPYWGESSSVSYALGRASHDTVFESRVVVYQLLIVYLIGFVLFRTSWSKKMALLGYNEIYYISNFIIAIIVFIAFATGQSELQARYITVIWQYMALISCICLKQIKVNGMILNITCFLLFIIWWYYNLYVTPFDYKGIDSFWYFTIFNYYYV